MVIVTVGGTLVHSVVHWLEVEPTGSISPIYYGGVSGGNHRFIRRSDGAVVATQPTGAPASYDTFVIYTVTDSAGNDYYVFYGLRWRGSMASTHKLLEWVQQNQLGSHTYSYEVWRWDDTNGDGMANLPPVDTYTLLAYG